jgi:hypothetical protein
VGPVAGIEAGIGWIGAETRIVVGGMIAVTVLTVVVAVVDAMIEVGDLTVVVEVAATVGAITKSILSSFPFHSFKS